MIINLVQYRLFCYNCVMTEEKLITLKLQVYSWISSSIGEENSSGALINKMVKAGTTLAGFFTALADSHTEFRRLVFNPETGEANDEVVIMLNNKLLQFSKVRDSVLHDQDTIILSPVLVGG
jgi:hypothetical protein